MRLPLYDPSKRLRALTAVPSDSLKIHEIYASVQGESTYAGQLCVFVRTTGCHLRCSYCDTRHAFYQGQTMTLDEIEQKVVGFGIQCVEITGGEPLLQANVIALCTRLLQRGMRVLLETSGSLPLQQVPAAVIKIVDIKTPDSGVCEAMDWEILSSLMPHDELKFVLCSHQDYVWAKQWVQANPAVVEQHVVHFGYAYQRLDPKDLVEWLLQDKLPVRFHLQWHKSIWDAKTRGV